MSVDAQALHRRLANSTPGEIITYEELSAIIRKDVQNKHRSLLDTARRKAQRDESFEFAPVRGIGLKRLENGEIADVASERIRRASRGIRKGLKMLNSVKYDDLTSDQKVKFNTTSACMGMMEAVGKTSTINRIEQATRVSGTAPSIPDISRLFLK